ncbi:uncharacterized protein LOC120067433 [Benincasa hispida]|uniref:uncharacterized protein LOC120067433 n=1 Tax=Benincasa hispida TaxID=102211 RepID=UPI0019012993|nr:uncharacterized protein LOC120067433 [Benincasa hispida]
MATHFRIPEADRFLSQVTSLAHIANANKIVKEKLTPRQLDMFKRTVFGRFGKIVKEKLTPRQLDMFKRTVFGRFVDVDMVFNSPVIHHMLLREITVVYYIKVSMMGKNKQKNAVDLKCFKDVQTLDYYNSLDWGTIIWERTLDALKTVLNDKSSLYKTRVKGNKNYVVKYSLRGFPQAFQVWTYEILASSIAGNIAKRRSKVALPRILRWSCSHSLSFKELKREIFESNNIKVKEGNVMSDAEREFRDTPVDGRPIFDLGTDDDSSENGNRSTSDRGSPESESDSDDHCRGDNDEVIRVEGGDEPEHSEHKDVEYGKMERGTYTPSDNMFHDVMEDVHDEDELNQLDVYLTDSRRERPVDEECPECAARHREGANPNESIYSYLQIMDNSLSRLDGRISGLDSCVSNMEENMTDMKGQLLAILLLLQSMCKVYIYYHFMSSCV